MNNKGFAITGILYGVLLLFLMVLISLLSVLVFRLNRFTTLVDEVSGDMEMKKDNTATHISSSITTVNTSITNNNYFQTPYRGKYTFTIITIHETRECYAYLPKNIVLEIKSNRIKYKEADSSGLIDLTTPGSDLTLIGCTNSDINSFIVTNIHTSTNS